MTQAFTWLIILVMYEGLKGCRTCLSWQMCFASRCTCRLATVTLRICTGLPKLKRQHAWVPSNGGALGMDIKNKTKKAPTGERGKNTRGFGMGVLMRLSCTWGPFPGATGPVSKSCIQLLFAIPKARLGPVSCSVFCIWGVIIGLTCGSVEVREREGGVVLSHD